MFENMLSSCHEIIGNLGANTTFSLILLMTRHRNWKKLLQKIVSGRVVN